MDDPAAPSTTFVLPIRLIHSVNSKLCTAIGSLLNLLLVWLVAKRTPRELKVYSAIILQTCVYDLILLGLSELVQWIPFYQSGVGTVVSNGPAATLPFPWNVVVYDLWQFMSYAEVAAICVQFVYRYQILCKFREYGLRDYFRLLLIALLSQLGILAFGLWLAYPGRDLFVNDQQILQILNESVRTNDEPNWGLREVLIGRIRDFSWLFFVGLNALNVAVCYSVIVFCAVKTAKFVRINLKMPNKKRVAEINRQMALNMTILALLPLINVFVYGTLSVVSNIPQQQWLICLTMLFGPLVSCATKVSWVPVLNPLVTICTVAPYRRTVFRAGGSLAPSTGNGAVAVAVVPINAH